MNNRGWLEYVYSKIGLLIISLILLSISLKIAGYSDRLLEVLKKENDGEKILRELNSIYFSQVETEIELNSENSFISEEHIEVITSEGRLVYPISFSVYRVNASNISEFHEMLELSFNHTGKFDDPLPHDLSGKLNFTTYTGEIKNLKIGKVFLYFNSSSGEITRRGIVVVFR